MSNRSSGHSLRRSSILKARKSRQPFQDLDFNPSSSENSPSTARLKRRVSFAEKKHVKKFSDHTDEGTIWDTTYEEPDHSYPKLGENVDDRNAKQVDLSLAVLNNMESNPFDTENDAYVDPVNEEHLEKTILFNADMDLEMSDVNFDHGTEDNITSRTIHYDKDDLDMTEAIGGIEPTVFIRAREISPSILTTYDDGDMILTEVVKSSKCSWNNRNESTLLENETIIFEDLPMDITVANTNSVQEPNPNDIGDGCYSKSTKYYSSNDSSLRQNIDTFISKGSGNKTILFNDMNCEMTETVIVTGNNDKENTKLPERKLDVVQFPFKSDTNAEIFEKNMAESISTTQLSNESIIDLTAVATNIMESNDQMKEKNKTLMFNNCDVDITEAVPVTLPQLEKSHSTDCSVYPNSLATGTKKNDQRINNQRNSIIEIDKTIIFGNADVDMTRSIPVILSQFRVEPIPTILDSIYPKSPTLEMRDCNQGMKDRTNVVTEVDRTLTFRNYDVDITTAGPKTSLRSNVGTSFSNSRTISCSTPATETEDINNTTRKSKNMITEPNKTLIFSNCDIDVTTAVPTRFDQSKIESVHFQSIHAGSSTIRDNDNQTKNNTNAATDSYKTLIFDNHDVDITRAVTTIPCESSVAQNLMKLPSISLSVTTTETTEKNENIIKNENEITEHLSNLTNPLSIYSDPCAREIRGNAESFINKETKSQDTDCDKLDKHNLISESCNVYTNTNQSFNIECTPSKRLINPTVGCSTSNIENHNQMEISTCTEQIENVKRISPVKMETVVEKVYVSHSVTNDISNNATNDVCNTTITVESNCQQKNAGSEICATENGAQDIGSAMLVNNSEPSYTSLEQSMNIEIASEKTDRVEYRFIDDADIDSDMEAELLEFKKLSQRQLPCIIGNSNNSMENISDRVDYTENDSNCCFLIFRDQIVRQSKSDDCIWQIRSLDPNRMLFDFISNSLIVAVSLTANAEYTMPNKISDIQFTSLVTDKSGDVINMIHELLLMKLHRKDLKLWHRTMQDILPMLECISQEVKLVIDFMYEFKNLQDLHPINIIDKNRISFHIHSYKTKLILRIELNLRAFDDIEPDDVSVESILGSVKEKDIKQLIRSVKKDHRFLTHFISDVKEYVALVCKRRF